jgi:hypothetical protein
MSQDQHLTDSKGRLVPLSMVKPVDLARDRVIADLVARAHDASFALARFKLWAVGELDAFLALSAEEYGITAGGAKGNVTLISFNGLRKVTRQIQDRITFDERLQAAKTLIDECVKEWSKGSDDKIQLLVQDAFQVDQTGKISTERVLGLRRIKIDDEKWLRAMNALTESIQVESSKSYLRFYERDTPEAQWRPISLDLAALETRS